MIFCFGKLLHPDISQYVLSPLAHNIRKTFYFLLPEWTW
jgi:hypothetical protein